MLYKDQSKNAVKEAMEKVMDAVNVMGTDESVAQGIIECLGSTHRTLQQNFWRVMLMVIKEYAKFRYDLRNEASVKLCQFIDEALEKDANEIDPNLTPKRYLPFV